MKMPLPRLSVVIPVYNEESIVREACLDLMARLDERNWDYELVISENGSRDGTIDILRRLSNETPRLRYIHSDEPNYGLALQRGILEARGFYVVADEIDLCDVGFYDRALAILEQTGADMVVGSKRAPGSRDHRPAYRRAATAVHNTLLRLALGFKGTDTHGVKAFLRESIAPTAARCVVDKDVFASELVLRAGLEGKQVMEIPVALEEKRPPSIALLRRVPNVLRQVAKLIWVLRVKAPPPAKDATASQHDRGTAA
ncbi:MAG TPA: glycosyltransferase family 2 protein [Anaeromyxobacteraceae bacterium]|nr:glycosyltransferase family 2 protein [Anaeromyxobacteraceae bacterium]